MPLDNNNRYRVIWNYPRPRRTSMPALYKSIIQLLFSDDKFSTLIETDDQKEFDKMLQTLELKRDTPEPRDRNPGGVRTIRNHLENLYLIWIDPETKIIYPTLAGEKLLKGEDIFNVMRHVILNAQFPSPAGFKAKVKMHPKIRIKHNLFVLRLLLDEEIRILTVDELFIPIIYGHNKNYFHLVKRKILEMRNDKSWIDVIDDPKKDLFTPNKQFNDQDDIENWYNYLKDIATTIIPFLRDVSLVQDNHDKSNIRYISLIDSDIDFIKKAVSNDRIEDYDPEYYESFQRKLGAYGKRDNRELTIDNVYNKKDAIRKSMQNSFLLSSRLKIIDELDSKTIKRYSQIFAVKENEVVKILNPLIKECYTEFEEYLLQVSESGTKKAVEFEKLLVELFEKRFKFYAIHTGQKKRQSGHNYSDILLVDIKKENAAIIDAKAIKEYHFPVSDQDAMKSYIENFSELNQEFYPNQDLKLFLCLFIVHTLSNSFDERSKGFSSKMDDIHCSGIDISELIRIANKENIGVRQEELMGKLKRSGTINSRIIS